VTGTFFQATQPVSAAALPLPAGAATEATLAGAAKDATVAKDGTDGAAPPVIPGTGIRGWLRSIYDRLASVAVTGVFWQATQPVSAAALPLPAGAATEAGNLASINTATGAQADAEAVGNGSVIAILKRIRTLLGGALAVTGTFWQAVQPVSGTFWQATQPVSGTFFQATQPVSGTVTSNQGTAGAAGWPTVVGIADSAMASGTAATPLAGAAIATIAAPGAGTYEIQATSFVTGAQGTQANMQLQHAAVVVGSLQSVLNQPVAQRCRRVTVAAAEAITINAIAADATVGVVYAASIVATRVA
jgi:hypothetical protein